MSRQTFADLKSMVIRHRFTLTDIAMIGGVVIAGCFAAWQYDIFPNETAATREHVFELDEIFAIAALAFALFAWSRLRAQRREIRRRRAAEEEARALAFEDTITGLPNRRQFDMGLKAAVGALPGADAVHAVFMLDLNGFKRINDVFGHPTGDEALTQTAIRLRKAVREGDLVARLGGDEFAVLARHLDGADAATGLALRIIDALKRPVEAGGSDHPISTGIGIALAPLDGTDAETLLRKADVALYRAKAQGVTALRFFEEQMDDNIRERDNLERELRAALGSQSLQVFYQPRIDFKSGTIVGFEAALRWLHPRIGELESNRLLSIAETAGLIGPLIDDLLSKACDDAQRWEGDIRLSFGIPPILLKDSTFGLRVVRTLNETGLPPSRLELEISESALVADLESAQRVLGAIHDTGVRIALKNFGTGYSSLYHLRNFRLDTVKIDRSLVQAMAEDPESATIVRALVGLGSGLGLTVAAEGVQNEQQQALLSAEGCEQGQGALFNQRPAADPISDVLKLRAAAAGSLGRFVRQ